MAYTVSRSKTVYGNQAVVHMLIDADATTGAVQTGLKNILGASFLPVSMNTTVGYKIVPNKDASGTAANGTVGISGVSSGDRFYLTVFGTR